MYACVIDVSLRIQLVNTYIHTDKHTHAQTGLLHLAETRVAGNAGRGLSIGQKKQLIVAMELLKLPSVIVLDEPTSGKCVKGRRERERDE